MSKRKPQDDHETVMMALDQISQTIEVMTRVVDRLRTHLAEQAHSSDNGKKVSPPDNQTVH